MESMNDEVSVKLTTEEIAERGETLAVKMLHVEHLRDKKKADAKSTQALIDSELDEAQRLAREITGQEELRKQGELFVDEQGAREALARVGEAACTCDPATPNICEIDCPAHGTVPPRAAEGLAEDPGDEDPDAEPLGEGA